MCKNFIIILITVGISLSLPVKAQTYLLGPQEFNSDVITHPNLGLTYWFAPATYSPYVDYVASGGNPGAYAGLSQNWTGGNTFSYLRLPQTNCSGHDTVLMVLDLSNSYHASQPNDRICFRLLDMGSGQYMSPITSIKINGLESVVDFGSEGKGFYFNMPRNWAHVEVKFNIVPVTNKTNILFFIEPKSLYNTNIVFSVGFDNISITSNVSQQPALVMMQSGNRLRCAGDSVSLRVATVGASPMNYQWKKNGVPVAGADSNIYTIVSAGTGDAGNYKCIVSNSFGADSSAVMILTVNAAPAVDLGNDTTLCAPNSILLNAGAGYSQYNWTTGATTSAIVVDTSGHGLGLQTIGVTVTDSNACSASSSVNITFDACASVDENKKAQWTLSPNPCSDHLDLISENAEPVISVSIFDISGRRLLKTKPKNICDHFSVPVDRFVEGLYWLVVATSGGQQSQMFMIRR